MDEQGRDCPDWVPGELWIGGIGVAEGYFNDPLRSEQQFLTLPDERWYRTGDLGCYWPDGTIEFLGLATSRSKSEDIASSWAKSKARSASWRG
mgnify:FL=1